MPLPIEVNHVLGRKSLTLAYREVDAPVTIGRSRECDVQIPSVTVGATHCMLFVHEGRWLLQESPDRVVTVNGEQIAGPVALQIGDVIGIGPGAKAPTIQIDPAAASAGKTGPAMEAAPPPGASSATRPAVIGAAGPRSIRPPKPKPVAGVAPPQLSSLRPAPPPEPEPQDEYQHAAEPTEEYAEAPVGGFDESNPDTIDFGQTSSSTASAYRRRRPKQSSGAGGMVVLFVVLIGGLGAVIYWAWNKNKANLAMNLPAPTPAPVAVAPPPATEPATRPKIMDGPVGPGGEMFDVPGSKSKDHHPAAAPSDAGPPAPFFPVPPPPPAPDPAAAPALATEPDDTADDDQDPDWLAVITAHSSPDQANAIIKYDGYRHDNPRKHVAQLSHFEADALEQLWWQHVLDLYNSREDLEKQMAAKQTDITDQPPGDFHKQLVAELADLRAKRNATDKKLTIDYGYTLPTPPDIDDPAAIAQLDAKRDSNKFTQWKFSTITWIREHNGKPPWADE
jgi:hypothetical protein